MRAIFTKVFGDLRRRLVQTIIVTGIVALAAGVGTLALALINTSSAPYEHAFAQNVGAHLTVNFNPMRVTADQLRATAQLPDVTSTAGPWPAAYLGIAYGATKSTVYMVGRPAAQAPLDHLQIVAGRWVAAPGEVVLTRSFAQQAGLHLGDNVVSLNRTDTPQLMVVGEVVDIDEGNASLQSSQDVWVMPDQVDKLLPDATQSGFTMLYRFRHAATQADIDGDTRELTAALPTGAIAATIDHLIIQQLFNLSSSLILSFLLAFAAFALGAVVLIVANVVTGAVLAGSRDIGITRALGFTPGQAVLTFVLQMLIPAAIGGVVGATLGALGSIPVLNASTASLGLPSSNPSLILPACGAVIGMLVVVSLAAIFPALRAGRLSPTVALALGAAPSVQHRNRIGELLQRIGAPRPVSLGTSDAFARPVRGILTTLAIVVGVATMTFAFGLHTSLQHLATDPGLLGGPDATVQRFGGYADNTLMSTMTAQPETSQVIAYTFTVATIPQTGNPITTMALRGDSASVGYHLFSGRWFTAPGEFVVASSLAREAHLHVGDALNVTINGHTQNLRLVGIYFTFDNFGRELRVSWPDYLNTTPNAQPDYYNLSVHAGTDLRAYTQRIYASAPNFLSIQEHPALGQSLLQTMDAVLVVLALVLVIIAIVGVLNTVLLTTHERVHDIATLKTLGMSPGQVILMVSATAGFLGIIGGVLGVPTGVWLHQALFSLSTSSSNDPLPQDAFVRAFIPLTFPLFAMAGIVVALIGASLPARWAARQSVVEALRAE